MPVRAIFGSLFPVVDIDGHQWQHPAYVLLTKDLGSDWNSILFTCAVVGLAFLIEFVLIKFISRFSGQNSAEK